MSVLRLAAVPKTHSKSVDELTLVAVVTQKSLEVIQLARVRLLHQNRSPVVAAERVPLHQGVGRVSPDPETKLSF